MGITIIIIGNEIMQSCSNLSYNYLYSPHTNALRKSKNPSAFLLVMVKMLQILATVVCVHFALMPLEKARMYLFFPLIWIKL